MQSEQKKIETLLRDLISLTKRVDQAVHQAKSFSVNCSEMGKQVCQLSQMLATLLGFITFHPILLHLYPIHCVISEVSRVLKEALSLACKCKSKTIFCQLYTGTKATSFPKLSHLLNVCIVKMNWLLLIHNPDFGIAFGLSFPLVWSRMVTEITIWEHVPMPRRETSPLMFGKVLINSRKIKEIDILMFCLAKLVEAEHGDLRCCLMAVTEITAAAETNRDLRCKAFKTKSPGSNAIVEQLLRLIKESQDPAVLVHAIKSIGSLAKIFCERENHHVIGLLVSQLDNEHQEVATEAVIALQKFACKDNYLHKVHSKTMVELNAVRPLVRYLLRLRDGERRQQQQGLLLMCHTMTNADYSEVMENARVRTAFQELLARNRIPLGCFAAS